MLDKFSGFEYRPDLMSTRQTINAAGMLPQGVQNEEQLNFLDTFNGKKYRQKK